MIAESGWNEWYFENEYGKPYFFRIHAGRQIGEGWREEDCPVLRFTIRNNRLVPDVAFTEREIEVIGMHWLQETGNTLERPLYMQVLELEKRHARDLADLCTRYGELLDEDEYSPES
jgi:hypothetical protein